MLIHQQTVCGVGLCVHVDNQSSTHSHSSAIDSWWPTVASWRISNYHPALTWIVFYLVWKLQEPSDTLAGDFFCSKILTKYLIQQILTLQLEPLLREPDWPLTCTRCMFSVCLHSTTAVELIGFTFFPTLQQYDKYECHQPESAAS